MWVEQAELMSKNGAYSRRHFQYAKIRKLFTMINLQLVGQLRNRIGIKHAFLEDPLLKGMLAARANRGVNQRIRQAVVREAQIEAAEILAKGNQEEAVRSLKGP